MPIIGIREFRNRACEIIRSVRDEEELYIVTLHGKPSALVIPLEEGELEAIVSRHHPFLKRRRGETRRR